MSEQQPYPQQFPPQQPWQQPQQSNNNRGCLIAAVLAGLFGVLAVVGVGVAYVVLSDDPPPPPAPTYAQNTPLPPNPPRSSDVAPTQPSPPAADPQKTLKNNKLYDAAPLKSANCAFNSSVALDSLGGVRAYYESVLPCLTKTWSQLKTDGIKFRAPKLKVFSGEVSTPCGGGILYSFYCGSNETIYMYADEMFNPWNQYAGDDFSHGITKLAAVHTIAHEFSHHIQYVTGIFEAMGPNWSGTELERRSELQASCLGNAFLSSQRGAYPIDPVYLDAQWEGLWRFITRVPNHGSEGNQNFWTDQGFGSARPGDCNTWVVSGGQVS